MLFDLHPRSHLSLALTEFNLHVDRHVLADDAKRGKMVFVEISHQFGMTFHNVCRIPYQ